MNTTALPTGGALARNKRWNGAMAVPQRPSNIPQKQIWQQRTFSTSPAACATHTIFNPQLDEDGNEMKLEITPRAANV